LVFIILFFLFYPTDSFSREAILAFLKVQKMAIWLTVGLTLVMLILWIAVVTEFKVTKAAHKYANSLLNSTYKL